MSILAISKIRFERIELAENMKSDVATEWSAYLECTGDDTSDENAQSCA